MPNRLLCALAILLAVACATCSSCTENNAGTTAVDDDSIELPQKVFQPFVVDSNSISRFLASYPLFQYHNEEIYSFYKNRNYQSAWFNEYGIVEQGGFFLNLLENFQDEGLNDSVLYYTELKSIYRVIADHQYSYNDADSLTKHFELLLTAEFFVYAQKVWFGLSEKTTKELDWYIKRKTVPSVAILDSILSGAKNSFTAYEPLYPQYNLLKQYLKKYRTIDTIPWDPIYLPQDKKSVKPGDTLDIIPVIKQRLFFLGDLGYNDSTNVYNDSLLVAVKKFQARHGLTADGAAGEKFFREINLSPTERIRQIEINMERCRWIPNEPQGNYVIVNIPEYTMHIYEGDSIAWDQKVVVGKSSTSTVIFNDELEYIVFSPYWVPTGSILNNEILPALKKDPGYLAKENMEAFNPSTGKAIDVSGVDWNKYSKMPYSLRQKPGGSNSLGWVKFIFPNEHSIYFHDTPSRYLFEKESRGFSHGCIRIEQPRRFAGYLLRSDSTYTKEKIDSLYYLGRETHVRLKEKLPVYIVYFTSWVDPAGAINFRRDIYGHDAKLEKTLFAEEDKN